MRERVREVPILTRCAQMFKGPNRDIEEVFTAPSSAVCGVTLDKKEYLIAGNAVLM